jgi:uncharacterized lipoprotein YmbA
MKRKRFSSGLATCFLALSLAGCGASAPVRYYGLVPVETESRYAMTEQFAMSVGPVRVAEYLNRYQIVTRTEDVTMKLGDYDRWTEPLTKAFQRTLTDNLATLLGSDRVLDFPAQNALDSGYLLPAQVTRFDTDSAGDAILEVQWTLRSIGNETILPARRSRYTSRVANPDDYASIVAALSELIGAFSRDIASALAEMP